MKANEFVLEHGWDAAKRLVENNKHTGRTLSPSELELKQLVESHDYIKSLGGISFVKDNLPLGYFGDGNYKELIQECLEDVESCL